MIASLAFASLITTAFPAAEVGIGNYLRREPETQGGSHAVGLDLGFYWPLDALQEHQLGLVVSALFETSLVEKNDQRDSIGTLGLGYVVRPRWARPVYAAAELGVAFGKGCYTTGGDTCWGLHLGWSARIDWGLDLQFSESLSIKPALRAWWSPQLLFAYSTAAYGLNISVSWERGR